jgi:hypothetical protein
MVVRGQPKTQNLNENKGAPKMIRGLHFKFINLKKTSSKIAIG